MSKRKKIVLLMAGLLSCASLSSQAAKLTVVPLSAEESADLLFMREEEKLARDTYLVLHDQWGSNAFSNISIAEQTHMDAILALLRKYRLSDPAASTAIGEYRDADLQVLYNQLIEKGSESALHGLQVGALIEEADMRDIEAAIERSQHADIDKVYTNLKCGSRNHLRAFAGQIVAMTGVAYAAQLLDQFEVDNIVNTPVERCGN